MASGDHPTGEETVWALGDPLIDVEIVWAPEDLQREEEKAWALEDPLIEEEIIWALEDLPEDEEIAWALGDPPIGEAPPRAPTPREGDLLRCRGAAAGTWTIGTGGGRRGGEAATGQ